MEVKKPKVVYVLSIDGKPMMPTKRFGWVRRALREGKAKVAHTTPFTIQLTYDTDTFITQDIIATFDPGGKVLGTAARIIGTNKVIYLSEVVMPINIPKKMKRRAIFRKSRRYRKTRYRESKAYHAPAKGWLTPTLQAKVNATLKEVKFILSILPITDVVYEKCAFDIHKLSDPTVFGYKYQQGNQYGFENVRAYVLARDGHKCQACKGKSKDAHLHTHHIQFRSEGGTDAPDNLLTLCSSCHDQVHKGLLTLKKPRKSKPVISKVTKKKTKIKPAKRQVNTKGATHVSIISKRLGDYFASLPNLNVKIAYGYETKLRRKNLGLEKTHANDAIAIGYPKTFKDHHVPDINTELYYKMSFSKGDYQRTKGKHSQKKIPTGKIQGFRKYDKVSYQGTLYYIKGRMTSGYAQLMDKHGEEVKLLPIPKLNLLTRIGARKTCMTMI